jgi:hypothetical protein
VAPAVTDTPVLASASWAILAKEETITANVLAALNGDHERKQGLIRENVPRLFRAQFQQFAGLRDSAIYRAIRERRLEYVSYGLCKEA